MNRLCLILILIVFACKRDDKIQDPPPIISLHNAEIPQDSLYLSKLIRITRAVKLETGSGSLIVGIDKIVERNNVFYILDKKADNLLTFNIEGEFLKKIGNLGLGPGEFPQISDFNINKYNDEILIYSRNKSALIKYDLQGNFKSEKKLKFYANSFAVLDKNNLAFFNGYFDDDFKNLVITDFNGDVMKKMFNYPSDTKAMGFEFTGAITKGDSTVLYTDATSSAIYEISPELLVAKKYQLNFGTSTWPESHRYNFEFFQKELLNFNIAFLCTPYYENSEGLIFEYQKGNKIKFGIITPKDSSLRTSELFHPDYFTRLFRSPVGKTSGGEFISVATPELVYGLNEKFDHEFHSSFSTKHPKLYHLLDSTKENENPIIYTYNIIYE